MTWKKYDGSTWSELPTDAVTQDDGTTPTLKQFDGSSWNQIWPPNAIPDSAILQEEDGDIAEYTGDTNSFNVVNSPTVEGSDFAVEYTTGGDQQDISASFTSDTYSNYHMDVHPADALNAEVNLIDSGSGNVVHGIYFRSDDPIDGIYYSDRTERDSGLQLVSGVSGRYYSVDLVNIDWSNETLDIDVDGDTKATNVSFINSGVPDTIELKCNTGSTASGGYVDNVDSV